MYFQSSNEELETFTGGVQLQRIRSSDSEYPGTCQHQFLGGNHQDLPFVGDGAQRGQRLGIVRVERRLRSDR
eukprot:809776-Prymnesium_polylepis.1